MRQRWMMMVVTLVVAVVGHLGAEPCAYKLGATRHTGPEVTGNYARPYLYSPDTRQWYPDPMYYVAKDALRRWHTRHDGACQPGNQRNVPKSYRPTVEK